MPILAVNQFGQIYETSPDREDGRGFGAYPEVVSEGDVTLGAAYLKAQGNRQAELLNKKRQQDIMDSQEAHREAIKQHNAMIQAHKQHIEAQLHSHPMVKDQMMRQALAQGVKAEYYMPLNGNVLSGNGCYGWDGLTRDQKVINSYSMGRDIVAHHVDREEEKQAQHRAQAEAILRMKARR